MNICQGYRRDIHSRGICTYTRAQTAHLYRCGRQPAKRGLAACENTLHYIDGVPNAVIPDNLKAAVTKSSRFEPTLNETFADFTDHYGTTILPAQAFRPRDKALLEGAVNIMYTQIYDPFKESGLPLVKRSNGATRAVLEEHNKH